MHICRISWTNVVVDHMAGPYPRNFRPGLAWKRHGRQCGDADGTEKQGACCTPDACFAGKGPRALFSLCSDRPIILSSHVIHLPRTLAALLLGLSQLRLYDFPVVSLHSFIKGYRFAMRIWSMQIPNTFTSIRCCHHWNVFLTVIIALGVPFRPDQRWIMRMA